MRVQSSAFGTREKCGLTDLAAILVPIAMLGVYVKAGLEKEKAALLVAIGGVRDGRKLVLAWNLATASPSRAGPGCCAV